MSRVLVFLSFSAPLVLGGFLLAWAWLATGYHLTGWPLRLAHGVLVCAAVALLPALWQGWRAPVWAGIALILTAGVIWWFATPPRADRDWAFDVARGVTADIDGDRATLHNVRNFDWQTPETAIESWETREFDLAAITGVDMIMSVWDSPAIAHTLISFGFADGQHIVFSGEIRKERGESFSALGGFFKKYELVMIAADERDIVRLRTDIRGEQVWLFPIDLPPDLRRQLFLNFVNEANALDREPQWYHTLLANCTTVPFRLVRAIAPEVPFDWRVIASGYLPSYLHELGVLRPDLDLDQILARAALPAPGPKETGAAYSAALRAGWRD